MFKLNELSERQKAERKLFPLIPFSFVGFAGYAVSITVQVSSVSRLAFMDRCRASCTGFVTVLVVHSGICGSLNHNRFLLHRFLLYRSLPSRCWSFCCWLSFFGRHRFLFGLRYRDFGGGLGHRCYRLRGFNRFRCGRGGGARSLRR